MRSPYRRVVSAFLANKRPCSHHGGQGHAFTTLRPGQRGFTLVELVLVIALAGVVAVLISTVLTRPLLGFADQSRRAELTDQAATALQRMARDLRGVVPNSVRESSGGLAFLPVHEAGRYRASPDAAGVRRDPPACDGATCAIEVLSPPLTSERVAEARWLVIYNVGAESAGAPVPGQNLWAYSNPGVVTATGASFSLDTAAGAQNLLVQGASGFRFAFASPQRRLYLAREAVRYRCDGDLANARGVLWRETFDTLELNQPPESRVPLAHRVSRCDFIYLPGTHTRQSLVTLRLSLTRDGETISLVQQVHVDNAP